MDEQAKSLGRWFSITYRLAQSYLDKALKPYNLGSGQGMFLFTLLHQDGITQECLSQRLQIDKGTTARAVKKLEQEGYVVKKVDPDDKRANLIILTEKTLVMEHLIRKVSREWTENLTIGFSEEEKEMSQILLKKMAANAINYTHNNK